VISSSRHSNCETCTPDYTAYVCTAACNEAEKLTSSNTEMFFCPTFMRPGKDLFSSSLVSWHSCFWAHIILSSAVDERCV